jgi:hypothetical protein
VFFKKCLQTFVKTNGEIVVQVFSWFRLFFFLSFSEKKPKKSPPLGQPATVMLSIIA